MFLRAGELKYFCEYINFVTTFISSFLNFDTLQFVIINILDEISKYTEHIQIHN